MTGRGFLVVDARFRLRVFLRREALGLSQQELVDIMNEPCRNYSENFVEQIETGELAASGVLRSIAVDLARALECTVEWITLGKEPPDPRRYEAVLATRERYK